VNERGAVSLERCLVSAKVTVLRFRAANYAQRGLWVFTSAQPPSSLLCAALNSGSH